MNTFSYLDKINMKVQYMEYKKIKKLTKKNNTLILEFIITNGIPVFYYGSVLVGREGVDINHDNHMIDTISAKSHHNIKNSFFQVSQNTFKQLLYSEKFFIGIEEVKPLSETTENISVANVFPSTAIFLPTRQQLTDQETGERFDTGYTKLTGFPCNYNLDGSFKVDMTPLNELLIEESQVSLFMKLEDKESAIGEPNLLKPEIVSISDKRYSRTLGASIQELINTIENDYKNNQLDVNSELKNFLTEEGKFMISKLASALSDKSAYHFKGESSGFGMETIRKRISNALDSTD